MPSRERATGSRRRDPHRRPQGLGQLHRVGVGLRRVDLRAHHDGRVGRRGERFDEVGELVGRQGPGRANASSRQVDALRVGGRVPVVVGDRHVHRPAGRRRRGVHGLADRPGHILGARGLAAPLDQGPGQLGGIDVGQHDFLPDRRTHLLARGHDERAVGVDGVGQPAHGVARAGRGMQVDQDGFARGQREAVGHGDDRPLVQAEDVAEVGRHRGEELQLVGAGVAEDRREAPGPEDVVAGLGDRRHRASPSSC